MFRFSLVLLLDWRYHFLVFLKSQVCNSITCAVQLMLIPPLFSHHLLDEEYEGN
jgi:hypothetical protein